MNITMLDETDKTYLENKIDNHTSAENPHNITLSTIGAAPAYTYGMTELTAGTSSLDIGKLYFVYV